MTAAMKLTDSLLGRKVVTNLNSVLKSWDITLLTKVCIVKAVVFPVVMYGCGSSTIKKAKHWWTGAFKLVLEKTLESPLDFKEIKPVNPKRHQPWIFTARTDVEAEPAVLWPPATNSSLEKALMLGKIEGNMRREQQMMRWLDSIAN